MRRKKFRNILVLLVALMSLYIFGVTDYIMTEKFEDFKYPLDVDIIPLIKELEAGKEPSHKPINIYPYRFLSNSGKCQTMDKLDLVILVKSAMDHFGHRQAIRQTWGQEDSLPGKLVKVLFFLGIAQDKMSDTQTEIYAEMIKHKDIIQVDFIDSYFNNTVKTMMAFKWAYQHCQIADYYLFSDDDMYISVRNLVEFTESGTCEGDTDLPLNESEKALFAGYVFESTPHRVLSSKWHVSLTEYPWDKWPRYVTAGAYILSNSCMRSLYLGSLFVKHFRFDDVYLGIVAKKVGIKPYHCKEFYYYKKPYTKEDYRNVIASHGFDDHEELTRLWNEQNSL